ncbi:mitochondrial inner membrane protease ATP23 homolog [Fopius arisanus]|uniref:Mitochondrial inner membrane protease ATP23 n=1 Tax=Fopius arisanus TaxID=64838 RepID=A0A9R1U555_9HYME|nr:PREDICTED: mitochondrial inner membrane protease ATP23 homolog [Fopius arisanus]
MTSSNEKASDENVEYTPPPKKTYPDEKGELWGHDLYPERRGSKKSSVMKTLLMKEGDENIGKYHCEKKVYTCLKKHPVVKLMMGALRASGCPIDIRRHITCEVCDKSVTGGYDPELNQIVVCQNTAKIEGIIGSVLSHEMIHMFDYCRNNLDFKNLDHLACTEVRAANLTYCSFMSAFIDGDASWFNLRKRHQECVKRRALLSVLAARGVTPDEAKAAVDRVFERCYNDMEPVGRRIRSSTDDMQKALFEGSLFGYDL